MRDERFKGIASKNRNIDIIETLTHFNDMKSGTEEGLRWCIRAKMSIDDPNKALRDPVIYRCNLLPHHRTGYVTKYCSAFTLRSVCISEKNGKYTLLMILLAPLSIP